MLLEVLSISNSSSPGYNNLNAGVNLAANSIMWGANLMKSNANAMEICFLSSPLLPFLVLGALSLVQRRYLRISLQKMSQHQSPGIHLPLIPIASPTGE
mmetsp:Transcript_8252/g.14920  ORF Transcript_8252/g.14920 Transcript_8252/m.14920 type:complete len:99 (-) Transcript_8252:311-607(-)